MEMSQVGHPGFSIEGDTLIIAVGIMVIDPLHRVNGEGVGHAHGYRQNGRGVISLEWEDVADPFDAGGLSILVDRSGLVVKVAASLAVGICNLCC